MSWRRVLILKAGWSEWKLLPLIIMQIWKVRFQVSHRPPARYLVHLYPVDQCGQQEWTPQKRRTLDRVLRMFRHLDAWLPGRSTCLTRALALQQILSQVDIVTVLHVGVKHGDTPERLNSHAWLSADGLVVAGGEIDLDFQELGQFGALVRSGSMQSRIHLAGRRKVS